MFDCRTCGACCVGGYDHGEGFADVTAADVVRMSRRARRRLVESRYADQTRLATPDRMTDEYGGVCDFLRGTPARRCSCAIYETRPSACSRFLRLDACAFSCTLACSGLEEWHLVGLITRRRTFKSCTRYHSRDQAVTG